MVFWNDLEWDFQCGCISCEIIKKKKPPFDLILHLSSAGVFDSEAILFTFNPSSCCSLFNFSHLILNGVSPGCICYHVCAHSLFMNCRVVESVGENVSEVTEGDIVLPIFLPDCGECTDCRSEKSNLCSKFPFKVSPWMPRYESSRFTDLKGEVLYHFLFVSSFSEYTVVDIANITKIDPNIPPNRACLFSCGVSTGKKGFNFVFFG